MAQPKTPREEHLEWAKTRALEYVEKGDLTNAYGSFISDLSKNEETRNHPALELGGMLLVGDHLSTKESMKDFINGFQ